MAILNPDITKSRVIFSSQAEETLYQIAAKSLPNPWRVYHSCNLSTVNDDFGLQENEMDFLFYHPSYGFICIEVKGGRIQYERELQKFYSIDRHGRSHEIKNPFQQASVWKNRFVRELRKHGLRIPVCHGVCFPSVPEDVFPHSVEFSQELIIGRSRMEQLEDALIRIAESSHPAKFLSFEDRVHDADKLLKCATFKTSHLLRSYIDSQENRLKDASLFQEPYVAALAQHKRLGIEGDAGTGKTLLATKLASVFAQEGKSVLYLSTNELLNHYVAGQTHDMATVRTYLEIAKEFGVDLLVKPGSVAEVDQAQWQSTEAPKRLSEAIQTSITKYDVIICDEAQDVQATWWPAFNELLTSQDTGKMFLFFDRNQGIFQSQGPGKSAYTPELILPVPAPYFPLTHNYRMTREIAAFAREFKSAKKNQESYSARIGLLPEIITYSSQEDFDKKLTQLMHELTAVQGIRTEEITLLSARNPKADESTLKHEKFGNFSLHKLSKDDLRKLKSNRIAPSPQHKIPVSTIASFKGLETSVGIVCNLSEYHLPISHPLMASLCYVAFTRARHMLYIFVREGDEKAETLARIRAGLAGQSPGIIRTHSEDADHVFSGVVHSFDAVRYGTIRVDSDQTTNQKVTKPHVPDSVMFFPADIDGPEYAYRSAKEGSSLIGRKVFFRMGQNNGVSYAVDIVVEREEQKEKPSVPSQDVKITRKASVKVT